MKKLNIKMDNDKQKLRSSSHPQNFTAEYTNQKRRGVVFNLSKSETICVSLKLQGFGG